MVCCLLTSASDTLAPITGEARWSRAGLNEIPKGRNLNFFIFLYLHPASLASLSPITDWFRLIMRTCLSVASRWSWYESVNLMFLCKNPPQKTLECALFTWRNARLVFVVLFAFTWLGCVLWSWDGVLAPVPALAYSSGLGANLCVSCLYSQACLHTRFHLGLFWRPVKTQASGTNSVCEKSAHACLIITGHTLLLSPFLILSIDLSSERRCLLATLHYCRLFEVQQEKKKVLIFKVLAAIPSHTPTHMYTHLLGLIQSGFQGLRWGIMYLLFDAWTAETFKYKCVL